MGAVHTLDFNPSEQLAQSEGERLQVCRGLLPIMSNASMIFLRRGDFVNAARAATAGLRCARKLPEGDDTSSLRAKLYFRRGLARGESGPQRDLETARSDLLEAVRLEPSNAEIRQCLATCTKLLKQERRRDPLRYKPAEDAKGEGVTERPEVAEVETIVEAEEVQDTDWPEAMPPRELSPAAEKFAEIVGRSLGKLLRLARRARAEAERVRSRSLDLGLGLWLPAVLIPALAMTACAICAGLGDAASAAD